MITEMKMETKMQLELVETEMVLTCIDCGVKDTHRGLPRCKDCNRSFRKEKQYDLRSYRNERVPEDEVCIYALYDNERVYIGSTIDFRRRLSDHKAAVFGDARTSVSNLDPNSFQWMKLLTLEDEPRLRDKEFRLKIEKRIIAERSKSLFPNKELINVIWNPKLKGE